MDAAPTRIPMVIQTLGSLTKREAKLNPQENEYRCIVGSLIYLMIATRPDLANAVGIVSRYLSNLTTEHMTAAKHILRYIKGTKDYGLTLGPSNKNSHQTPFDLYGYTDAD